MEKDVTMYGVLIYFHGSLAFEHPFGRRFFRTRGDALAAAQDLMQRPGLDASAEAVVYEATVPSGSISARPGFTYYTN